MVEWSRRRRGMYDITKTRMLLTTAVFAAVAALSASGANARIPADTSSASAVQESLRTGRYAAQPPSWRGKGGKGEETGGATNPLQRTVATAPAFPSGDELDTAISTAMATRAARESGTLSGKLQNTSDVVSRYLDNDRMGTGQFSVGYRGRP
jgi:hypothetical protein